MAQHTILIVAASRGLGLGLAREYAARGWRVIATVEPHAAKPGGLAELGDAVRIETVDINHTGEVLALRDRLSGTALDVLFVNAGVANGAEEILPDVGTEDFVRTMTTNALSPLRVIEALAELVTPKGTIAAMTSGLGSVSNNTKGGWEVYRASKAALNTLLRSYAVRSGGERTIVAMAPGWVKTDMGGPNAVLDVETSVRGMADVLTARAGTGGVTYVDYRGEVIPW